MKRWTLKLFAVAGVSFSMVQAQTPVDYKALHNLLIKFYGFQRAGDKSIDNKNPFYKTSPYPHSQDALSGNDLSGGWYDAGDFVKFGLPFGYATYCLLKGYDVFPRGYDDVDSWDYKGAADQIPDILGEVKIATDYLLKAVISPTQIVTDVGNAGSDHGDLGESGYANSTRTSPRQVYATTGADIAGVDAAALALMSMLYAKYDSAYAAKCLAKAKDAYKFGQANPKLSTQQNNGEFYKTVDFNDKMACAAIELYRATKEASYLTQAKTYLGKFGSHYFVLGYNYLNDIASFEYKRQTGESTEGPWLSDVAKYMSRKVPATGPALIRGAFINSDWGNAGNAGAAAFSAGLAFTITGDSKYLDFARSQVHWVAGLAPSTQSYVVGFGTNPPTSPHHRNDNTIGKQSGPRLKGGVVSGPTPTGGFDPENPSAASWSYNGSDVNNYKNTEVALDYNAGMTGAVAFLRDYDNPPAGLVRIAEALKVTPGNVDLTAGSGVITGKLETSLAWKIILTGRLSKATRTVTGTGTAISITWKGEADAGTFQTGEQIDVVLDAPNIATYHQLRAKTSFFLTGAVKEEFKATDVIVDNFEDGDTTNAQGGTWTAFTDKAQGGASYTSPATLATAIAASQGDDASKGLSIRLIGAAGAPHPFSGIRTTFNAAGTAVSLGTASSLVFDIKAAVGDSLRVELEQGDITDNAHFGKRIDFGSANWIRVRIPFSSMTQPEWKTSSKTLNTGSIASIRFTNFSTNSVRFYLDNLRVEGLQIGGSPIIRKPTKQGQLVHRILAGGDAIAYQFNAPGGEGIWSVEVNDVFGHTVGKQALGKLSGNTQIRLDHLKLGPGWYFLRHQKQGASREWIQRIWVGPAPD